MLRRVAVAAVALAALFLFAIPDASACDCGCAKAKAKSEAKPCDCPGKTGVDCPHRKKAKAATAPKSFDQAPKAGAKATCPVMGEEFTVKKDSPRSVHKGKHYVFCCPGCKPKFDKDPGKYTAK